MWYARSAGSFRASASTQAPRHGVPPAPHCAGPARATTFQAASDLEPSRVWQPLAGWARSPEALEADTATGGHAGRLQEDVGIVVRTLLGLQPRWPGDGPFHRRERQGGLGCLIP